MPSRADFVVYSPDHKLQLVVEVKGTQGSDAKWAAKLRRNLLAHDAVPNAPYFMLVLPDMLYLWSGASDKDAPPPNFYAKTRTVLAQYLSHSGGAAPSTSIGERGLQLAVHSWLSDLTKPESPEKLNAALPEFLTTSGLAERVRTGFVKVEAAV